jgi:hypothetical protein
VPCRCVDRSAVRAYSGNVSHLGQRVEVIDADVACGARPSDVKAAAVGVSINVIESAIASDQLNLEDLVWTTVLSVGETYKGEHDGEGCND